MKQFLSIMIMLCLAASAKAQIYSVDDDGQMSPVDTQGNNRNFNKHNNDTTANKEIPKGLRVWRIDRQFGDIIPATPDTMQHLYMNTVFNTGLRGEYNTTGNNYTPRLSRIVIDRPLVNQELFTQPYSWVMKQPDELLFTNTLSPFTNISYDNCGDKTNGEDHIDALFAVNAGKRLGMGFDLNYAYARGYYSNQNASHFGATFFASYLGDQYNMHAIFSTYHQKVSENGGITDDNYITHPESFDDSYSENEIPTVLSRNWNRNNNIHFYLTHRYSLGFYRKVKMTEEEIKARQFAAASKKEHDKRKKEQGQTDNNSSLGRQPSRDEADTPASGRPDGATIAGDEPVAGQTAQTADTTRILVDSQQKMDSLLAAKALQDSIDATMKSEFVPVTSFIHTLDLNRYDRIYTAYQSPKNYYANTYYNYYDGLINGGDSIYDQTRLLQVKNTVALALLEGFNKYAKAGLKAFASHEYRRFELPELTEGTAQQAYLATQTEHALSVGGQISKTEGKTLHYNLKAETWLLGEDLGQLKLDFTTDLNFRLWGDTVTLAAKAYFYRLAPTYYQRHYHAKHFWWDNDGLNKETRTRIEGLLSYRKTQTSLRVAIEEIQNYTYFGMSYDATTNGRTQMSAGIHQAGGNINLLTAQLRQDFRLGILRWENTLTYQNSSNGDVLPVPTLNVFSNLYLKFKIVNELAVDLGGDVTFFTKYYAPDFAPQLNQFCIQQNVESRVKTGDYPYIDVYANMHLKHTRFFVMFSHVTAGNFSRDYFLTPHYPQNSRVFRIGVSWNFFN